MKCLIQVHLMLNKWLTEFFQPNVVLNFGSRLCVKDFPDLVAHFIKDHQQYKVRHDVKHIDVLPERIYVRLDAIFIIKHDPEQKEITVNALSLIRKRIDENKISSAHIFVDRTLVNERLKLLPSN